MTPHDPTGGQAAAAAPFHREHPRDSRPRPAEEGTCPGSAPAALGNQERMGLAGTQAGVGLGRCLQGAFSPGRSPVTGAESPPGPGASAPMLTLPSQRPKLPGSEALSWALGTTQWGQCWAIS